MNENTLGIIITLIGTIIGLLFINWQEFSFEAYWGRYCFVCLSFALLIIFLVKGYFKHRNTNKGSKILMELQNRTPMVKKELAKADFYGCQQKMHNLCSKISDAFTTIKGNQISTCVKYLGKEGDVTTIKTLARDNNSLDNRNYPEEGTDTLNGNYDFQSIVINHSEKDNSLRWGELYYCINNLPHVYGYYNSHLKETELSNGIKGFFFRHHEWKLPYKSCLIVPISNCENDTFYGFLCIDSKKTFCFNIEDKEYLKSAANSIWEIVGITISKLQES